MSQRTRTRPRRVPPSGTRKPDSHHLPSPSPRSYPPPRRSSVNRQPKPAAEGLLKRSSSEPRLGRFGSVEDGVGRSISRRSNRGGSVSRHETCTDVNAAAPAAAASSSSSSLLGMTSPPPNYEGPKGDAKVVVNVTVEGSPGPIRAMVRLGSSVEDTIRLVMDRYGREGRAPKLLPHHAAPASFELHPSHFSLHGLDKSELIGDVGSRSFYLRRSSNGHGAGEDSASLVPEVVSAKSTPPSIPPSLLLAPTFVARRIGKIIRRTPKLWRFFICFQ
ncbi:uncharacterized protein At4g22758-like [Syzygium oleosum]|uniref:uncharacterized protein At4g22758-like n=1 Tax=Syzygium oleosum TaxID=219896 RepID=UPI0024B8F3BB|nr:uncharacterized protein At4g22758-like [Syzygium oleosum]